MGILSAYYEQFQAVNTEIYAILVDELENAKTMASRYARGKFPIYYDLNKTIAKALNQQVKILRFGRMPGMLILDKQGIVQFAYYSKSMSDIPPTPEILELLKKIAPGIKTFAVLTDQTPTGRSHQKKIEFFARKGLLPVSLVETVATNDFEEWKRRALELQQKVDAFFVAQLSGLKDASHQPVSISDVMQWYLTHIKIPEASGFKFLVEKGMLCCSDDSPYNQGFEAVVIAHDIFTRAADPATYPARAPKSGRFLVNRERALMLELTLPQDIAAQDYIEKISALQN